MSKRTRRTAPGDTQGKPMGAGGPSRPATPAAGSPLAGSGSARAADASSAPAPRPAAATTPGGPVPGAFGNRRAAGRVDGSSSPTGTPRAGRRLQPVAADQSFLERYRNRLIAGGIVAAIVLIVGFVFAGANTPAYACSIQLDPASPAPSGSGVTGQLEDDMTRGHVAVGTSVTYTYCPPASGKHYNSGGLGPIKPQFYGPDSAMIPQSWVHNLEHGGLVILYNCSRNGCDTNSLDQLRQLATSFPASPRCGLAGGLISPVITRFDNMKSSFAAVVWDRVLFQDKLDLPQILEFFKTVGETTNPEQQCNPSASGSPVVSGNPASPDATSDSIGPAPSGS